MRPEQVVALYLLALKDRYRFGYLLELYREDAPFGGYDVGWPPKKLTTRHHVLDLIIVRLFARLEILLIEAHEVMVFLAKYGRTDDKAE